MHTHNLFSSSWRTYLLALVLAVFTGHAWGQWQWLDKQGRPVFSDTPPPPEVSDKQIQRRPAARSVMAPQPAAKETALSPEAKSAIVDPAFEAGKKQSEATEQARQKAETERLARTRADNCERARRGKATLDSGMRIASVNAKGEQEILDDKARAAESLRLDEIVRSDCAKPSN